MQQSKDSLHAKLSKLSLNLWWTWSPAATSLFNQIDEQLWHRVDHNPVELIAQLGDDAWSRLLHDEVFQAELDRAVGDLERYLNPVAPTWGAVHAGILRRRPVVYLCAEFGIHESLPIYSGGLGVLAGDHLKSASDLGIPLIGVGLFYREGYFRQTVSKEGRQESHYITSDPSSLPLELLRSASGDPIVIEIPVSEGMIRAQVWKTYVGRVPLFLLETEEEGVYGDLRGLSKRLYGGDLCMRLRQEMLLGIGSMMLLEHLGVDPGALHLNEGHCAFALLELARQWKDRDEVPFWDAYSEVAARTVFTTHTPVVAGHDRFPVELFEENMGAYRSLLGVDREALLSLGRERTDDPNEAFCMTVMALKSSRKRNAVSALHGRVTRRMWQSLYPGRSAHEVPIGHITNGVHLMTWMARPMCKLLSEHFGSQWTNEMSDWKLWRKIDSLDDQDLWAVRRIMKMRLIRFVRQRVRLQWQRWGFSEAELLDVDQVLEPEGLIIGFARRFATYKRASLVFSQLERLEKLLFDPTYPIQFVFAGKAHPHDEGGQALLQEICQVAMQPKLRNRIVFLEDYDLNIGRHLVQGVDLWLNNPRKPLEASGTSGQKVVFNGGLNLSVLDGWWPEAWDGDNGFALRSTTPGSPVAVQDKVDAEDLFHCLVEDVLPLYKERDENDVPLQWVRMMKAGFRSLAWRFNTHRMLMDYTQKAYLPAADAITSDMSQH